MQFLRNIETEILMHLLLSISQSNQVGPIWQKRRQLKGVQFMGRRSKLLKNATRKRIIKPGKTKQIYSLSQFYQ